MTGQVVAALVLAALIVAVTIPALLRDLRATAWVQEQRRLGGWFIEYLPLTGGGVATKVHRSPFIPWPNVYMGLRPRMFEVPKHLRLSTDDDLARQRLAVRMEERLALTIQRPTTPVVTV